MPKRIEKTFDDAEYEGGFIDWDKPLPEGWFYPNHYEFSRSAVAEEDYPLKFKEAMAPKVYSHVMRRYSSMAWFVSKDFKALVEKFEPDVHTFIPTEILMLDGTVAKGKFYVFKVGNVFDALNLEHPGIRAWRVAHLNNRLIHYKYRSVKDVYFDKDVIGRAAIWSEKNLKDTEVFCSDEFADAVAALEHHGLDLADVYFYSKSEVE